MYIDNMCINKAMYVSNVIYVCTKYYTDTCSAHTTIISLSLSLILTTSSCPTEVNRYTMELTSRFPGLPPLAATSRSRPLAMETKVKARAPTVERVCREGETGSDLSYSYSYAKQWRQADRQTDGWTDGWTDIRHSPVLV